MRQWINLFERTLLPDLEGLDLSTYENFYQSLGRIPKENLVALNDILRQKREAVKPVGWIEVYHGAPTPIAQAIIQNGFQLGKGKRALGFMGGTYTVDVQGIFLSDSKRLSSFFGSNRDNTNGVNFRVLTCYIDPTHILDFEAVPKGILKAGLEISNRLYDRSMTRRRLNLHDWWSLLDQPEFVQVIKQHGFTGVRYKEELDVRRNAGDLNAHTYFIMDPTTIRILERDGWSIKRFYEWLKSEVE